MPAYRTGFKNPEAIEDKTHLQVVNSDFTSSKSRKATKEALKIAADRQFRNENEVIESDPENQAEAKKLTKKGYMAIGLTALAFLAYGAKEVINDALHPGGHQAAGQKLPEKLPMQPLREGDVNPENIPVTAETFHQMKDQTEITVQKNDTPGKIVGEQAPQLAGTPAGDEMAKSLTPTGVLPPEGAHILVANPGVEIQPAAGNQPAIKQGLPK